MVRLSHRHELDLCREPNCTGVTINGVCGDCLIMENVRLAFLVVRLRREVAELKEQDKRCKCHAKRGAL